MKKISEFATLCGTSPKTLRFYERIGLLKATYTNPENGYRYYSDEQEREYGLITVFKEMGFTLEEIKNNILRADDAHILEILRQKEEELQKALKICAEQIAYYENTTKYVSDDSKRSITIQRYDTERRLVVSDGTAIKTFTCPADGMDICTEVIKELFCVPGYVNLSLADVPDITEDRPVLVHGLEGTMEEILSPDHDTLFDKSAHISDISTVLLSIKIFRESSIDEIDRITSKYIPLFSQNCAVLWGASFDNGNDNRVKVCMIGVY